MDKIFSDLSEWIKDTVTKAIDYLVDSRLKEHNARLIGRKKISDMLDVEPATFDKHYRHLDGFPRELPACKWSLPAVISWIEKQD